MSKDQQGATERTTIHVPNLTAQGNVTPSRLGSRRERLSRAATRGHVTSRTVGTGMPAANGVQGGHVARRVLVGPTESEAGRASQGHVRPRPS
jgi:hypothetical protein